MASNNAILNHEQQIYLNGIQLSGVTNVDGGYSIDENPINIIGKGYTYPVRQGPLVGNFSISKYYIGKEDLLNYTGITPISGSINSFDQSFGFESGFLTEYSINAGIGQIPQANASIVVHGNIGSGIDASGTNPHPPIQIPNQGSISINAAGYTSNRITDFNYSMRINRSPIYKIGSAFPVQVETQFPIIQEASFSMDVNDYEINQIQEYLISPKQQNLNIQMKNPINDNIIDTFYIANARLLSQNIRSSSDDLLSVELTYNGYVNKK